MEDGVCDATPLAVTAADAEGDSDALADPVTVAVADTEGVAAALRVAVDDAVPAAEALLSEVALGDAEDVSDAIADGV